MSAKVTQNAADNILKEAIIMIRPTRTVLQIH